MRTALVERARDGDEDAFTELVDSNGDRCYAIAYRILRDVDRAKDAVQQAFLLAWRELPRLRGNPSVSKSGFTASSSHNLLIEVAAPTQATFSDLVPAAMPVIQSSQFKSGGL
jgi:DNA-directed RNA polymerase specialized sigma24 family protein